ncbi:hypothetical protein CMI37_28340 [Candidatus Pacearchaeota archaeon]|nr:hypothetical protein [Candidatus Pacearchaeota archaeon]
MKSAYRNRHMPKHVGYKQKESEQGGKVGYKEGGTVPKSSSTFDDVYDAVTSTWGLRGLQRDKAKKRGIKQTGVCLKGDTDARCTNINAQSQLEALDRERH